MENEKTWEERFVPAFEKYSRESGLKPEPLTPQEQKRAEELKMKFRDEKQAKQAKAGRELVCELIIIKDELRAQLVAPMVNGDIIASAGRKIQNVLNTYHKATGNE